MKEQILFQYAIIWSPTKKQSEEGEVSKILKPIETVLASDTQEVLMRAVMELDKEYKDQLSQIKIPIRAF